MKYKMTIPHTKMPQKFPGSKISAEKKDYLIVNNGQQNSKNKKIINENNFI